MHRHAVHRIGLEPHAARRCHRPAVEILETRAVPATLTVNTSTDATAADGVLTLREAIRVVDGDLAASDLSETERGQVAGTLGDRDTIAFRIPADQEPIIRPSSPLPALMKPVTIDGTTQPGESKVRLLGLAAGAGVNGLSIFGGASRVVGLTVEQFDGAGLIVAFRDGTTIAQDTFSGNRDSGVLVYGNPIAAYTIDGNVFDRNQGDAIKVLGNASNGLIVGNTITDNVGNGILIQGIIDGVGPAAGVPSGSAVRSNIIASNARNGVAIINGAKGASLQGNTIGLGPMMQPAGNGESGVLIQGSPDNQIGSTLMGGGNVISRNGFSGISILGAKATGNVVVNNRIGTNPDGAGSFAESSDAGSFFGNLQNGITVGSNSTLNRIGGAPAEMNVISGNGGNGVALLGVSILDTKTNAPQTAFNFVLNNHIGVDLAGDKRIPNVLDGVRIENSLFNVVGENVISGNGESGIEITGKAGVNPAGMKAQTTTANLIYHNKIGTDASGRAAIGNGADGITIVESPFNFIGYFPFSPDGFPFSVQNPGNVGNVISGNRLNGIRISDVTVESSRSIGTSLGLALATDSEATRILGTQDFSGVIFNNYIGTDVDGQKGAGLGNNSDGVLVEDSTSIAIGYGTFVPGRNVISGNGEAGVELRGTTRSLVTNNLIGTTADGESRDGNRVGVAVNGSSGNVIGTFRPSGASDIGTDGNVISANTVAGVLIYSEGASRNLIQANNIGTDRAGDVALGNGVGVYIDGVLPASEPSILENTLGGLSAPLGNVIAGNPQGVVIIGAGTTRNLVRNNFIGTSNEGTSVVSSTGTRDEVGILIDGSYDNTIGAQISNQGNVIAGYRIGILLRSLADQGTSAASGLGNLIDGNFIGTTFDGKSPLRNGIGILVDGVPNVRIGSLAKDAGNVISANDIGIEILGTAARPSLATQIVNNFLGTANDASVPVSPARKPFPNQDLLGNHIGIYVEGATDVTIGGTAANAANLIAGQKSVTQKNGQVDGSIGIYFYNGAVRNTVQGNFIGKVRSKGARPGYPLGDYGILIYNSAAELPFIRKAGRGGNLIAVGRDGVANMREFTGNPKALGAQSTPSGPRNVTAASRSLRRRGHPEITGRARRAVFPNR